MWKVRRPSRTLMRIGCGYNKANEATKSARKQNLKRKLSRRLPSSPPEGVDQRSHKNLGGSTGRLSRVENDPNAEEGEVRTNPHSGNDYVIVLDENRKKKACCYHARRRA